MNEKVLFTGKTHTVGGSEGYARSSDGEIDIKMPEPHPTAEKLFGAAWSACFIGAIGVAAARKKVKLEASPEVEAVIELLMAEGEFFLRAKLHVTVPGIEHELAEELVHAAHGICPYSKATRGNIEVETTVA